VYIDAWPHLRRAAYLAGCRCLRDELVVTGRFARLDALARHFALLPVVVPSASLSLQTRTADDVATLTAQGYLCLFRAHTLQPTCTALPLELPLALRQRLALMFADAEAQLASARPRDHEAASSPCFPTLLDSAILHAKSNSNAHPSPRH
ncbi:MAG TPA: hypothetical protein VL424_09395, partial [Pararobbsia sp.]|nr:hypothetical protein [Pararobbsia sp.]